MHIESNPLKGIFYCLLGYFFIALMGIFSKSISHTISVPVILLFQNATCLCLTVIDLLKSKRISLKPNKPVDYIVRIGSGLACYATLFFLIRFIPVSEAMLYQYSASLWIPFIMAIWLRVKMRNSLWMGIIVGFIGMICILKPGQSMFGIISIVGVLSGILQGISVVAIRKLSGEPVVRVLFYYYVTAIVVAGCLSINNWSPIHMQDALLLFAVGTTTYLGQKLFAHACYYAHPSTLAPICYISVLYAGILGWIIWHEVPDHITLLGMALVITGCLMTVYLNRRTSSPPLQTAPANTLVENPTA